ncbi:tetraacyldisaccharide 4'-kinase [Hydrogenophaga sp. A37]|uniref:tetraacyldisaccharide 4'-kinase n=1 Tax=Hydrogenophaga sp. A37 TaxID=1945864 RepID=UPI000987CF6A|nr:tetraacyldisaccharide 4'-kinase [Hydrogenophaga sp. A37]OOG80402.1 tetraacyldisaccharide 4'-kinase [Hydrogenophaga sp. A37]
MSRAEAQARWHSIWARRGWQATILWPLSLLYGALSSGRRRLYTLGIFRTERLPVPVIVVGNVVVGGAGKTPTVLALLDHLKARGWTPGVVSRGHGRQGHDTREVLADTTADDGGDEPTLIRRASGLPVFVARHRVQAAQALLAAHPEVNVLLCDDGLQHLALGRDLAIAVFDDRRTGNGWLLPAGLLREPWPPKSGQIYAPDMVLRQQREGAGEPGPLALPDGVAAYWAPRRLADEALGPHGERCALTALQGQPLTAVAGIARPEVFFEMLRERGLTLNRTVALPDHAGPEHFRDLLSTSTGTLLCTEKDAVKLFACLPGLSGNQAPACWAVPLQLRPEAAFFDALDQRLAALPHARLSSTHGHQTA